MNATPPVPPAGAPDSRQPADPNAFAEVKMDFPIHPGPFQPTWDSVRKSHPGAPAWCREAKFGVFVHWGPQAFGQSGDWYARNLYRQGHPAYENHLARFGHPSEVGYKDVLRAWTAPRWDPAALTAAFHDAGMRFMMVVGVHHDNFDLWDSAHQPWNSVKIGPKQDMLAAWSREARARSMRFGITFHHEYSWWWWADAYASDRTGPRAGVPYDGHQTLADGRGTWWEGLDPRLLHNIDLREYHQVAEIPFTRQGIFDQHLEYARWYAERWALRILDAVEKYDPDLIYTDGNSPEPFSGQKSGSGFKCDAARRVVAHYYNRALTRRPGSLDVLACIKFQGGNPAVGMTYEDEVPEGIVLDQPWIGENPIGDWYYAPNYDYSAVNLVRSLLEYASRDGSYACAVPIDPEGGLDAACVEMLAEIGRWMRVNGEGIYGSGAWETWGAGPARANGKPLVHSGRLNAATAALPFTPDDLRFTLGSEGDLYVWLMAVPAPGREIRVRALAGRTLRSAWLLGVGDASFRREEDSLVLVAPSGVESLRHAVGFRLSFERIQ